MPQRFFLETVTCTRRLFKSGVYLRPVFIPGEFSCIGTICTFLRKEICAEFIYAIDPLQKRKVMRNLFMRLTNKCKILRNLFMRITCFVGEKTIFLIENNIFVKTFHKKM